MLDRKKEDRGNTKNETKAEEETTDRPLKRLKRSLTIDNLWIYILSILKDRNMHAYNIFKEMDKRYGLKPGLVTPYVVLYKLEEDKYIIGYDSGRRRYYKITEKGKNVLRRAKEEIKKAFKRLK
ncbi:MAG: PadR family transcriptional regulator [Candidatus Micrarchaeota archaeon]|nr:PadR family transcriptional regulator [Candidatus Micrarchaeota archaeon]